MNNSWLPPRLNLEKPADDCRLDHVVGDGRARPVRMILSNSFGFGGLNASLVLCRVGDAPQTGTAPLEG